MILAFCCKGREVITSPDTVLDERFGRCGYFVFYNSDDKSFRGVVNSAGEEAGGAGIKAVQIIADQGTSVLIAREVGPQGMDALNKLGIKVFSPGENQILGAALQGWLSQTLSPLEEAKGLRRV